MFALGSATCPRQVAYKWVRVRYLYQIKKRGFSLSFLFGAGDRTRTGTLSPAVDFESTTSTIPSHRQKSILLTFSGGLTGCGARYLPRLSKAFVSYRPLPIAQVASSATGGAPIAPHHTGRYYASIHYLFQNSKCKFKNGPRLRAISLETITRRSKQRSRSRWAEPHR